MERLKWHQKLDKPPIPADVFDLIGGTSTGGSSVIEPINLMRLLTFQPNCNTSWSTPPVSR